MGDRLPFARCLPIRSRISLTDGACAEGNEAAIETRVTNISSLLGDLVMKLITRMVAVAATVAVSGAALACTTPFKITKMPKGTTINTIVNGAPTLANPYAGTFVGFQQQLLQGLGTTGTYSIDPVTGATLMTELGLDGTPTVGKYTVIVAPDAYMPSFGGSLALYTTVINQQSVQQMVAGYSVIPGVGVFNGAGDDGAIRSTKTLGGYNIFRLHACVGPVGATVGQLTINNANVLAGYNVDNGVVYVVNGVSIPQI